MNLDDALKYLYKPKVEFLICGDKHRDYLNESNQGEKKKIASLLTTYNVSHTANFASRTQNNLCTAIDKIFLDNSRRNLSSISPSDHDAQILTIKN
jgi:hypothetical protein